MYYFILLFHSQLIDRLVKLWPYSNIVHGKPCHSQTQGSVERANQDVECKLVCWMNDNKSEKWSTALKYVQYARNRCASIIIANKNK